MKRYRALLGFLWVPALSGCMMMGGMGHMGGMGPTGSPEMMNTTGAGSQNGDESYAELVRAEASSQDLKLALSFPLPSGSATVPIEVRLDAQGEPRELTDAEVWLEILAPEGKVDSIRMHHLPSSALGTFQVQYSFPDPGPYVVTAEGRAGTDASGGVVSVRTKVEIGDETQGAGTHGGQAHNRQHGWLTPAAAVGGLSMVVMMVVMIGAW